MIKTRFAPSPTGYLHVGGLRTALYCYLFARANRGHFILRIEDTDQERFVEGATEALIKTLDWIGLDRDEGSILKTDSQTGKESLEQKGPSGPYIQSERSEIYRAHADELIEKGAAYYCFCTKERLDELRRTQEKSKQSTMYDRKCGEIPLEEARKRIAAGESYVIRQRIPYETLKFKDLIRGNVQFDGKIIDDQILVKSDGFPTYHLANVVDDHLMEITHVIRGEEWLPSTPKHIFLYRAFGWKEPEFAHIPLLLNKDRSKLSKRQGHVAVEEYINDGYIKEAIINFVALLGWHPGSGEENELFSLADLEEKFSLDRVHKAGAIFDIEKLDWFNWLWQKRLFNETISTHARTLDPKVQITEEKRGVLTYIFSDQTKIAMQKNAALLLKKAAYLFNLCKNNLRKDLAKEFDEKTLTLLSKALLANEEKILKNPRVIDPNIEYFFKLPEYDVRLLTHEKMNVDKAQAKSSLDHALEALETLDESGTPGKPDSWTEANLKTLLLGLVEKMGIKTGQLLWPIRAAITGQEFSPGAFEMLWALEKEESLTRIKKAIRLF